MNNINPKPMQDIFKAIDFPYQTKNSIHKLIYLVDKMNLSISDKRKLFERCCDKKILPLCSYLVKSMPNNEQKRWAVSLMINKNCPITFGIKNILSIKEATKLLDVAILTKNQNNINLLNDKIGNVAIPKINITTKKSNSPSPQKPSSPSPA